jgi:hypothetical protein
MYLYNSAVYTTKNVLSIIEFDKLLSELRILQHLAMYFKE